MLLGPRHFPDFRIEIICNISREIDGAVKKEVLTLLASKSKHDLLDFGIFLAILWETLTKYLLKMLAITGLIMSKILCIWYLAWENDFARVIALLR